jgi:carbon-monoxide dehydrogenase medium subunit
MKSAPFDYAVASDVTQTTIDLQKMPGAVKLVAGNQSLGPMLNLRLVRTRALLDVSHLLALRQVQEGEDSVFIGAATTHAEIEDGEVPDPTPGWMRAAATNIAHRAVRNKGTIGGSLVHADPAADWVVVLTGLDASVRIEGVDGPRDMPVADFITGPYTTALGDDELVIGVTIPKPSADACWGYWKFTRQVGEFAKASATVLVEPTRGIYRCVLGALGRQPFVLDDPQALIDGHTSPSAAIAQAFPSRPRADLALHVAALIRALAIAREKL